MFQSTRPVWSATRTLLRIPCTVDVSIYAPRVERDDRRKRSAVVVQHVSIYAPRVERDPYAAAYSLHCRRFNLRAPCGARRSQEAECCSSATCFNLRDPCGARPVRCCVFLALSTFQSTRPVWSATIAGSGVL